MTPPYWCKNQNLRAQVSSLQADKEFLQGLLRALNAGPAVTSEAQGTAEDVPGTETESARVVPGSARQMPGPARQARWKFWARKSEPENPGRERTRAA
jgi:hypothetical protein